MATPKPVSYAKAVAVLAAHAPGTTYPINQDTLASSAEILTVAQLYGVRTDDLARAVMIHRQHVLKMRVGIYSVTMAED